MERLVELSQPLLCDRVQASRGRYVIPAEVVMINYDDFPHRVKAVLDPAPSSPSETMSASSRLIHWLHENIGEQGIKWVLGSSSRDVTLSGQAIGPIYRNVYLRDEGDVVPTTLWWS